MGQLGKLGDWHEGEALRKDLHSLEFDTKLGAPMTTILSNCDDRHWLKSWKDGGNCKGNLDPLKAKEMGDGRAHNLRQRRPFGDEIERE